MSEVTRRWRISPRPLHLETLASYRARVLSVNQESETQLRHLHALMRCSDPSGTVRDVLSAKTGRDLAGLGEPATPTHPDGSDCELCRDGISHRWLCVQCSGGTPVRQVPHFRANVCIPHRRFTGPGTGPEAQPRIGAAAIRAERKFRRLLGAGRLDAHLYQVLARAVRRARPEFGDHGNYPLVIDLAELLTRPQIASAVFDPTASFTAAYATLHHHIAQLVGPDADRIGPAVWVAVRATFLAAREHRTGAPAGDPVRPHEKSLTATALCAHDAMSGPVESFSRYLAAAGLVLSQRNKLELLTDYSLATQTLLNSDDSTTERPVICAAGHRLTARSSRVMHASTRGVNFCPVCNLTLLVPGVNSLDLTHPGIANQLDPTLNPGVTVTRLLATSTMTVHWVCPKGHHDTAGVAERVADGCRLCTYTIITPANCLETEYPELAAMYLTERNLGYPLETVAANSNHASWWRCPQGHAFFMNVRNLVARGCCPHCRRIAANSETVASVSDLAAEWDDVANGTRTPENTRIGSERAAAWICPDGHEYTERPSRRARGYGCPVCGSPRKLRRGHNDAATVEPVLMREFSRDNGPIEPQDLVATAPRRVRWTCIAHGHESIGSIPERKSAHGCPNCSEDDRVLSAGNLTKSPA